MTKKRRYLIVAGILGGCVAIALGVLVMLPPQPSVTKANFDRIEKGMMKAEAEAILGEPLHVFLAKHQRNGIELILWEHQDGTEIVIQFEDGEVRHKQFRESTIPDKLRRWLHLPK